MGLPRSHASPFLLPGPIKVPYVNQYEARELSTYFQPIFQFAILAGGRCRWLILFPVPGDNSLGYLGAVCSYELGDDGQVDG